jgi:hypothetical protein
MTFSTTPSKRLLHGRLEKRSSTSNTRNANGLDFLPLYSPDLNQIASVWKLTRQLCLHNVYFPKLDQLCATVEQAKAAQATFIYRLL